MLLSCLVLASVVVAVLLWAGDTVATGPEPNELQHGITVSSPAGQVAVWGHVLVRPGGLAYRSRTHRFQSHRVIRIGSYSVCSAPIALYFHSDVGLHRVVVYGCNFLANAIPQLHSKWIGRINALIVFSPLRRVYSSWSE